MSEYNRYFFSNGILRFHEYGVMIFFLILVALWFSRHPEIIPGWADYISSDPHVSDKFFFVVVIT